MDIITEVRNMLWQQLHDYGRIQLWGLGLSDSEDDIHITYEEPDPTKVRIFDSYNWKPISVSVISEGGFHSSPSSSSGQGQTIPAGVSTLSTVSGTSMPPNPVGGALLAPSGPSAACTGESMNNFLKRVCRSWLHESGKIHLLNHGVLL